MEIEEYLLEKGIKPHYSGFAYLATAIKLCQEDAGYLRALTTRLYVDVAKRFSTNKLCVERNIRTAIQESLTHTKISEFISMAILEMKIKKVKKRG